MNLEEGGHAAEEVTTKIDENTATASLSTARRRSQKPNRSRWTAWNLDSL